MPGIRVIFAIYTKRADRALMYMCSSLGMAACIAVLYSYLLRSFLDVSDAGRAARIYSGLCASA